MKKTECLKLRESAESTNSELKGHHKKLKYCIVLFAADSLELLLVQSAIKELTKTREQFNKSKCLIEKNK